MTAYIQLVAKHFQTWRGSWRCLQALYA